MYITCSWIAFSSEVPRVQCCGLKFMTALWPLWSYIYSVYMWNLSMPQRAFKQCSQLETYGTELVYVSCTNMFLCVETDPARMLKANLQKHLSIWIASKYRFKLSKWHRENLFRSTRIFLLSLNSLLQFKFRKMLHAANCKITFTFVF